MTEYLIRAYIALLRIPSDDLWRVANQHVYVSIRDAIADRTKQQPQMIQETFEAYIIISKD
jgi:hypothetical protein